VEVSHPEVTRVPRERIVELVKLQHGVTFIPIHFANLELSARAPYNAALGRIDVTNAFWNTTTNIIDLQPKSPSAPNDNDVSLVSGVFLPPTTNIWSLFTSPASISGWTSTVRGEPPAPHPMARNR
jgi:hypothetical protein